ncbi:uncharacterized protein AB675_3606 [Cyphellophora attinorum]|uniref:Uncharacterized protein n=1 Tax=Cyphellophora attinorum TaxID=1664694 RepID=A0A0N0NJL9_9EURO|nr:uncharacterized protein AB675_3606 [Phialophora attinorum]KPI37121.1 hypothetical protein AB675_3606 [Phialophora attinorum]
MAVRGLSRTSNARQRMSDKLKAIRISAPTQSQPAWYPEEGAECVGVHVATSVSPDRFHIGNTKRVSEFFSAKVSSVLFRRGDSSAIRKHFVFAGTFLHDRPRQDRTHLTTVKKSAGKFTIVSHRILDDLLRYQDLIIYHTNSYDPSDSLLSGNMAACSHPSPASLLTARRLLRYLGCLEWSYVRTEVLSDGINDIC